MLIKIFEQLILQSEKKKGKFMSVAELNLFSLLVDCN